MIYCIRFADFSTFMASTGFVVLTRTERSVVFVRDGDGAVLTVRAPNDNGDITEQAALAACDAAGIDPIAFDVHWCD